MKHAVSNIGLPPYDHAAELPQLAEMGLKGLEVSPSRVWRNTWHGLKSSQVENYRKVVEKSGLRIIGLHSLFFDHPDLSLFGDTSGKQRTANYLIHLSALCRDLGGKTLIYGSRTARTRGERTIEEANAETIEFFTGLCHQISDHGTCYCFEPLAPEDGDFIHSVSDSLGIVKAVDSPALKIQIDAKALYANGEMESAPFQESSPWLVHYHANEPGLVALGTTGKINHELLGQCLRDVGYQGYVSIEQRMLNDVSPLKDTAKSVSILKSFYA